MRTGTQVNIKAIALALSLAAGARGGSMDLQQAEEHYRRTDYGAALRILLPYSPKNASVYALIGKTYFMDGQYRESTAYFEKAIAEDSSNSGYYDWLGRAYGRRAEEAVFVAAIPFASKTRESFERAVALDSRNLEALGDLFEYYLQAPGIVGGGVDKAQNIAVRIGQVSEIESHYVRARLAEKRKDHAAAEQEYRKAMDLAPADAGRIVDLARFLCNQGKYVECDALFVRAEQAQPDSSKVLYARAAAYVHSGRNLPEARRLLQRYLELPHTPDDPSRSEVSRLLKASR